MLGAVTASVNKEETAACGTFDSFFAAATGLLTATGLLIAAGLLAAVGSLALRFFADNCTFEVMTASAAGGDSACETGSAETLFFAGLDATVCEITSCYKMSFIKLRDSYQIIIKII